MIAQTRPDIANVTEQTVVALKELEGRISVLKGDLANLCQGLGHPEAARIAASPAPGTFGASAFAPFLSPSGAPFGTFGNTPFGSYGNTPFASYGNPSFGSYGAAVPGSALPFGNAYGTSFGAPGPFASPWTSSPNFSPWASPWSGTTATANPYAQVSAAQYAAAVSAAQAALANPWGFGTPFATPPQATPSPFATVPAGYR